MLKPRKQKRPQKVKFLVDNLFFGWRIYQGKQWRTYWPYRTSPECVILDSVSDIHIGAGEAADA